VGGVLVGFAVILSVIGVGYLLGRLGIITPVGGVILGKVAFFAATPALLFTVMASADVGVILSEITAVAAVSFLVAAALYLLASRLLFRRPLPETLVGMGASGYVNANNIGLPVAVYVIGDAQYTVPVLLMQLLFFAPTLLALLDFSTRGHVRVLDVLLMPVRNPLIIAVLAGVVVALLGIRLPEAVLAPFEILGGAAIPMVLMSFGASLRGERPLRPGSGRRDVLTATAIKSFVMPAVAWAFGAGVLHLDGHALFAAVVFAALPTAQNIFNFAQRYDRGVIISRDTVLLTTALSVPVMLGIAAVLAA